RALPVRGANEVRIPYRLASDAAGGAQTRLQNWRKSYFRQTGERSDAAINDNLPHDHNIFYSPVCR
ncbi:MAG: hypothetical protein IJL89_04390, partial [Firmicutes bacterium]|nr:hypothetical protein [Bacillota bacterium]